MPTFIPNYFGKDKFLFGAFHRAQGTRRNHAIVIAPPLMNEYMRSHSALRLIALELSQMGFDVLRFDYLGTGSSHGSIESATLADWTSNLVEAADEAMDISGASELSIIAIRFSAAFSATLSHVRQIQSIVTWDPLFTGSDWLSSLRRSRDDFARPFEGIETPPENEVMGHLTHKQFESELRQFDHKEVLVAKSLAVITNGCGGPDHIGTHGTSVVEVDFECGWERRNSQVLYPRPVVAAVLEAFS